MSIDGISELRKREIAEAYRDLERKHGADVAAGLICLGYTLKPEDVKAIMEENDGRLGTDDGTAGSQDGTEEDQEGETPAAAAPR
jgi:hypothetical protein